MIKTRLAASLLERIQSRTAHTGVIGLGYVGLPLAVEFGRAGFSATGIDLNPTKVRSINEGRSYIGDVPDADLAELRAKRKLWATTDFDVVAELDTINICVPTPLRKTKDPDMSFIVSAVEQIAGRLRPGTLVILESTTYPGTTDEIVRPMLESTGMRSGVDFFLAFSPERIDPGNARFNTRNVPKVVGGTTTTCSELAAALYGASIETVVPVSSTRVAEMAKLLENTFRAVNIGMVNEMALMCDRLGIDVWEVIRAASTKPFGFMPFYPGPGLGGHCIPVDPFYLSWKARQAGFECRFIELAGQVNGQMPHHVVTLVSEALNNVRLPLNGARVLVAGVAYKKDIEDMRESPSLDVMSILHQHGAELSYIDPFVPTLAADEWPGRLPLQSLPAEQLIPGAFDCVLLLTDHSAFDYAQLQAAGTVVVDTRNAIREPDAHVLRLGAAHADCAAAPALAAV